MLSPPPVVVFSPVLRAGAQTDFVIPTEAEGSGHRTRNASASQYQLWPNEVVSRLAPTHGRRHISPVLRAGAQTDFVIPTEVEGSGHRTKNTSGSQYQLRPNEVVSRLAPTHGRRHISPVLWPEVSAWGTLLSRVRAPPARVL